MHQLRRQRQAFAPLMRVLQLPALLRAVDKVLLQLDAETRGEAANKRKGQQAGAAIILLK